MNLLYEYPDLINDVAGSGSVPTDLGQTGRVVQRAQEGMQFVLNMGKLETFNSIVAVLIAILLVFAGYIFTCYMLMYQGRKRHLNDDWQAYVPIVKSVYRMDLVGESRWKLFFVGGVAEFLKCLMVACVYWVGTSEVVGGVAVVEFLLIAYLVICVVFKYFYDKKFFAAFSFNPGAAFIGVADGIASMYVIMLAFAEIGARANGNNTGEAWAALHSLEGIAFAVIAVARLCYLIANFMAAFEVKGGNIPPIDDPLPRPNKNKGKISCVMGMYSGADFDIESDFEVIIGRDSYYASIVITENNNTVSRKHCGIRYIPTTGNYEVTDYSSNGTYTASGERLGKNIPQMFPAGTTICLGDKSNRFKLM